MEAAINIRPGAASDAESVVRVHFAAVHQTASAFYPSEVLRSWSPRPDENRWSQARHAIAAGDELFVVAEIGGVVRGFGSIVLTVEELRAIYVEPVFGRRGVGSMILERLEEMAAARGVSRLRMDASVNAEAFYRKHGYSVVEHGVHRLACGAEMACVKMSKEITGRSR